MSDAIASELLKSGLLGALIVVLAGVVVALWRTNNELHQKRLDEAKLFAQRVDEVHSKRLEEAQAHSAQMLKVNTEVIAALNSTTATIEADREMTGELKQAFRELADDIRKPRRP